MKHPDQMIGGPDLRRMLGISAVTLWRWRHDQEAGFPPAKSINGRLYFPLRDVEAWIERRPKAADQPAAVPKSAKKRRRSRSVDGVVCENCAALLQTLFSEIEAAIVKAAGALR